MSDSFGTPWIVACQVPLSMWFPRLGMEWVAIFFSRGSSRPRDWACVSCIGRQILYAWATRKTHLFPFSSVQLLSQVWPFVTTRLQPARLPCPLPRPRACSNSCPSSWWCHPTISSSVIHFSACLQSFPASRSFQTSQLFTSGGQSIGVSASASVLPMNIQDWIPVKIDWFDLIAVQGTLKCLIQHHSSKASILRHSAFFMVQVSHP